MVLSEQNTKLYVCRVIMTMEKKQGEKLNTPK